MGPRLFSLMIYGSDAMTSDGYFFWIPLVAPLVGGVVGAFTYLFMISAHWPDEAGNDEGVVDYAPIEKG